MLDQLIRGFDKGRGTHKDYRGNDFGFEEHKEFVTHVESEGGHFDRQAHYDHRMRLPANHGRPPMSHMTVWDEEDEDSDVEYFESSQSHHTNALPHHQQPSHLNFMPPLVPQPHHNGKMGNGPNGWQGRREDGYHSGHGMQQNHGRYEMQQHHGGGHEMQKQHGGNGMQQYHGRYDMQQDHGGHEMQQDHGRHEMQKHHDRLMVPQGPTSHVYMSPIHGSGDGRAVVVKTTEKLQVRGGHRKLGWGSKGL